MMCAIEAGKRGRSVMLLDHSPRLAEKIRISGGGRCNFTNRHTRPENFLSNNPHFCRSALARFTPSDFIALIEKHGIRYHEKKLGQLFCDHSSQQIIDLLKNECDAAGVVWQMPSKVSAVKQLDHGCADHINNKRFTIQTDRNTLTAHSLVIATGGLSIPQIGASDFGYRIARQFSIPVTTLRPALVGMTFSQNDFSCFKGISGVATDAEVSCQGASFRENILWTHRGLSGPAILQISSYWNPGTAIHINLLPQQALMDIFNAKKQSSQLLANLLANYLPKRLVHVWCNVILTQLSLSHLSDKPVRQFQDNVLKQIAKQIHDWQIVPSGTVGYKKAEVTLGGVDTYALSSKTMEATQVPGLYFIGEVVDVTGQLGGFNFQWAWSSGYAAGQAV
ncbi:MAG TPA: aminoacetone oxidase family FAD-binding enzyme [Nitrosomonas sp.]|uniref:NAD(P)/FAD-dependent oxidoreductase n=1 Tax=Nitrosomonas sp. TaxID=42353 RepID=UPI000E97E563|nr:aminoacetone oxidase family FAD-binding enzyme [Nitrosomonas sp.]